MRYIQQSAFKTFAIASLIGLAISSPLLLTEKVMPSLWLNAWHSAWGDTFFASITALGSGYIYIPLLLWLLYKDKALALAFALSIGLQALIVYGLKTMVFEEVMRPAASIPQFEQLKLVAGVDLHRLYSFPSGHSQTAFLSASFMAASIGRKSWGIAIFMMASLIAISRVYIFQHFFIDIWFGSAIGLIFSYLAIAMLQKIQSRG